MLIVIIISVIDISIIDIIVAVIVIVFHITNIIVITIIIVAVINNIIITIIDTDIITVIIIVIDIIANIIIIINIVAIIIIIIIYWSLCPSLAASARDLSSDRHSNREIPGTPAREERVCPLIETASIGRHVENIHGAFIIATNRRGRQIAGDSKQNGLSFFTFT